MFETRTIKEYRSAPKNNNSSLLQGKKQGILKYTKKKKKSPPPPVGQTLGSAILMKRPCPWGGDFTVSRKGASVGKVWFKTSFPWGGETLLYVFFDKPFPILVCQFHSCSCLYDYLVNSSTLSNLFLFFSCTHFSCPETGWILKLLLLCIQLVDLHPWYSNNKNKKQKTKWDRSQTFLPCFPAKMEFFLVFPFGQKNKERMPESVE